MLRNVMCCVCVGTVVAFQNVRAEQAHLINTPSTTASGEKDGHGAGSSAEHVSTEQVRSAVELLPEEERTRRLLQQMREQKFKSLSEAPPIEYIRKEIPKAKTPAATGTYYDALIPDTPTLAEHARLWINMATETAVPEADYESTDIPNFSEDPIRMRLCGNSVLCAMPKFEESLPLMRIMSGSEQNLKVDKAWAERTLKCIGPDGLYYIPRIGRPWDQGSYSWVIPEGVSQYAYWPTPVGRRLGTLTIYYQMTGDEIWKDTARKMIDRIGELVVRFDDKAVLLKPTFVPGEKLPKTLPEDIRSIREEADPEHTGETLGNTALWQTWLTTSLAQYYRMTGYEPARDLSRQLGNYIRGVFFYPDGKWYSHHHCKCLGIVALAELAYSTNDKELGRFVQKAYEWGKNKEEMGAIPSIGYFPVVQPRERSAKEPMESCSVGDMTAIALKLTKLGIADYWDDVDKYVRNSLIETQVTRPDQLTDLTAKLSDGRAQATPFWDGKAAQKAPVAYNELATNTPERLVGWYATTTYPTEMHAYIGNISCCSGNCSRALYYAWNNIVHHDNGVLKVNLLLNRASKWADIDSYIPYLGKVEIRIKMPVRLQVRMNDWIDKAKVTCKVDGRNTPFQWSGKYVDVGKVAPGQVATIEFPITERQETVKSFDLEYQVVFRGNDVVDISPKGGNVTLYQRGYYRSGIPRYVKVKRFVPDITVDW